MKLRVNAFRLTLSTNKGPFGAKALFNDGLNVIRAENTSGKSTLINGMLYALGIEILVGKRGVEATKPVMWSTGDYEGNEFKVLESFVELEATNEVGETVTIRRHVAGTKDPRLIEVVFGPLLTGSQGTKYQVKPFYVGMEGSAQRERGFHHFLSDFFNLKLPYVKRFKGEDVPLYVECITPLMFIEQIRGWSGIQATLPQSFGIRNVAKLAVEYILGLDVIENEKRRIQISEEANQIREDWRCVRESLLKIASQVGGRLMSTPVGLVTFLPDEPWIAISTNKDTVISLAELLISKRSLLIEHHSQKVAHAPRNEELEIKLNNHENELLIAQAELSQLRSDLMAEEEELRKLRGRLEFIVDDIQRNKDIKRLRDFGVETDLSIVQDKCPTCNQAIRDSLVPTESLVMNVEENINFLNTEDEAIHLLISAGEERVAIFKGQLSERSLYVANIRSTIRDLRDDLIESRDISVAKIREEIHLQEEVIQLEKLLNDFDEQIIQLKAIADRWQENRTKASDLPEDYFSKQDKAKLINLSDYFARNVVKFGYRSTGVTDLHISSDNYRPVCDDFEVAFGASASDNIRLIWAYTLALLQVSISLYGNHWGIVLFDEPEQQKMKEASSDSLYAEIANMPPNECQVIIATSASEEVTRRRLQGLRHSIIDYGDRVIKPL